MRATYYISFDAGSNYSQFYPTNSPKVKLSQEPGEIFFRWRIDTFRIGATNNETIYTTLSTWFTDTTKFTTDILYQIKENGIVTYEFIGPVLKGKLDTQNKIYECIPDPDDEYRDILLKSEIKWQDRLDDELFGISDVFWAALDLDAGVFSNINFSTFSDVLRNVSWSNATSGVAKARNNVSAVVDRMAIVKIKTFAGDNFILRGVDSGGVLIGGIETITGIGEYCVELTGCTYLEMYSASVATVSGSYTYDVYIIDTSDDIGKGGSLKNCLTTLLADSDYMNLSIATIYSTILWNDALGSNPPATIASYMTANPVNDYVIENAAIWNNLWLARTDNFTDTQNDILETSFKDIMDILKLKLRMYWFIDEDGHFRIEHEKYFRNYDAQADLTSVTYIKDKPEIDRRIYDYTTDLCQQENYNESNESNADWQSYPVRFTQIVNSAIKDINIANLSTDLDYIIDNPSSASKDGYMLIRTIKELIEAAYEYIVSVDESPVYPGTFYLNGHLSWAYILANYHSYFADAKTGFVNAVAYTFDHVKEFLHQEGIRFHPVASIDWKKPFTLASGTGWLTNAEYEPETGMCEINIGFNPYELDSEGFMMLIDDEGYILIDDEEKIIIE